TGSLGLDLAITVDISLIDQHPQRISTGIYAPLLINNKPYGALLLGRLSTGLNGVFILPGLIDSDYAEEIQIIVQALFPPIFIPKGSRLVQLVPLQQLTVELQGNPTTQRENQGLGSTGGLAVLTVSMNHRPMVTVTLTQNEESISLDALLDTGADLTIVS
ncbi:POK9 protein, partial [Calyptomena viridis]|nr:POK9 protein [Calyptomena viridis]